MTTMSRTGVLVNGRFGAWFRLGRCLAALIWLAYGFAGTAGAVQAEAAPPAPVCAQSYTVITGDTLSALSQRFGLTMQLLAQTNGIVDWNKIYVAQVLCIPAAGGPVITPPPTVSVSVPATVTVTATPAPTIPVPATGTPVFTIAAVTRNNSVTIRADHFPPNTAFAVLIGAFGTLGVAGTPVTTTTSSASGTFTVTYTIPAAWANADRLAIRLQNTPTGYYSYNWFWNFTTP